MSEISRIYSPLLVVLLVVATTLWLAVPTWKARNRVALPTKLSVAFVVGSAALGTIVTLWGLLGAIGLTEQALGADQKAEVMARGVAEVVRVGAYVLAVWLPSTLVAAARIRKELPRA